MILTKRFQTESLIYLFFPFFLKIKILMLFPCWQNTSAIQKTLSMQAFFFLSFFNRTEQNNMDMRTSHSLANLTRSTLCGSGAFRFFLPRLYLFIYLFICLFIHSFIYLTALLDVESCVFVALTKASSATILHTLLICRARVTGR